MATSSQEDMALVVAGTDLSPVASSSGSPLARELAAVIMGGGGRVTPGHQMTWAPPTPSPAEELPFGNRCDGLFPETSAVIKLESVSLAIAVVCIIMLIISKVEYGLTKAEVIASIGESIPITNMPPNSGSYAIHIMFDRQSAKSGDCYVEFPTASAATLVMNSRKNSWHMGKVFRNIGGRRVYLRMSSQEELMQEVFPRAKCVTWIGSEPIITPPNDDYSSGFAGFITSEELVMTNRWANEPHKSKYTGTHPQRPYESMITLLFKGSSPPSTISKQLPTNTLLSAVPLVLHLKLQPHPP